MLDILLINDNKIISRLLQLSSKKSGFNLEESGLLSPIKESYNLIFIDSDKYTPELIENIKSTLTYDKLVFIGTSQAKQPEEFELVLEKPFLPADFTSLVESSFIVESQGEDMQDSEIEEIEDLSEETDNLDDMGDDIEDIETLESDPESISKLIDDIEQDEEEDSLLEDIEELDLNEELLSIDDDKDDLEVDDEELPNIDDELEEDSDLPLKDELELDEKDSIEGELDSEEDFLSIDEDELKEVVDDSIKNSDESDQQPSNSEDIKSSVKEQFNQLITTDLIKEALKDMKITITFSDKD
jgi:hypothetical protein